MDDIYIKLYEDDLKLISNEVFKNHFIGVDNVDKVDRDEYNKLIEKIINELLYSDDDISEDIKTEFVFRKRKDANEYKRLYNKEDGYSKWYVINNGKDRYEIIIDDKNYNNDLLDNINIGDIINSDNTLATGSKWEVLEKKSKTIIGKSLKNDKELKISKKNIY